MKAIVLGLVLLVLVGVVNSLSLRQKRHTNFHHLGKKGKFLCLPLSHVCLKSRWGDCCSGYCGMDHSGPGGIRDMQMMKYGTCMSKGHTDADHHKKKKISGLEALSG